MNTTTAMASFSSLVKDGSMIQLPMGTTDSIANSEIPGVDTMDKSEILDVDAESFATHEESDSDSDTVDPKNDMPSSNEKKSRCLRRLIIFISLFAILALSLGLGLGLQQNGLKTQEASSSVPPPPDTTQDSEMEATSVDYTSEDVADEVFEEVGDLKLDTSSPEEATPKIDTETQAPMLIGPPVDETAEWPELIGKPADEAEAYLKDLYGDKYLIQIVPFNGRTTKDLRWDRIRIHLDEEGNVIRAPTIGR